MRISGYSDFNLKSIISKNNSTLIDFLNNNSEVKGKIIDVKSNVIKLLLNNGNQLIANSNIPLENLLGEEVNFRVLKNTNGIVLQPKIEGTALEKELNLKINNLMSELQIQNSSENKELIKEMIKQNIPVNKDNFKFLKENVTAFRLLSNFPHEEIESLYKNSKNIENKDVREVVRNIYLNNEGKNLIDFLGDLKNSGLKEKDILFLFKNNFKLNIENLKNLNDFLTNNENIETVINKINSCILGKEKSPVETIKFSTIGFENIIEDKNKISKNIENQIENKFTDIQEDNSENNINLKKDIKDIIKSIIKNLETDKEVNIEKIKKDLDNLLKNIGLEKNINFKDVENKELNDVSQKLEFLNKLSNDYMYFQVPFYYKEYKNLAEILLNNKNNKREKDDKSISIFISLNTHNLDRIDSMINYNNGDLKIIFGCTKQNILNAFKLNASKLINSLKKIGIKNVYVDYKLKEENESILSNLEYINNSFSNFNIWV